MPFPLLVPSFFFSAWLLMIFWGMVSPDLGIPTAGYPKAMLVTIGLWLVVFPVARKGGNGGRKEFNLIGRVGRDRWGRSRNDGGWSSFSARQTLRDDEVNITSSFSGISRRLTSKSFRGGAINTNFGGVQLDMRDVTLADNEATLQVQAFVGGVEITVPEGWDVEVDVATTLGGISDERSHGGSHAAGAPRLRITGTATAGGIKLLD